MIVRVLKLNHILICTEGILFNIRIQLELYIFLQEKVKLGIREAEIDKRITSEMTFFNEVS